MVLRLGKILFRDFAASSTWMYLTGADPLTGVVLPCLVGAALAASRVDCATHAVHAA